MDFWDFGEKFSDFLSFITIGMCFVQKVPQIVNLVSVKSVKGMSVAGLFLELTSYSVMASYNYTNGYSLITYMEYPIILFQQYILIYFVLKYLDQINAKTKFLTIVYFVSIACFLLQIIPRAYLTIMAPLCTPISASGKIVQLLAILREKNADSVSVLTWLISTLTNLTRVFTVWMDSADVIILGNFLISVALSASVMFSAIYFKYRPKKD